jgi:hypothetical protein
MDNKKFLLLIVTIIILVAALTYALKSCNDKKKIVTPEQQSLDSLLIDRRKSDSIFMVVLKDKQDSLLAWHLINDSLSKAAVAKDKALEISKAKVALLIAKSYILQKDNTQQQLDNCDSIKREAIYLTENITDYQRAQETLMQNNKNLLATMQRTSELKDSVYSDLKGQFDFLAAKYSKLDYNYQKAEKKANKRFGIGVQAGYTYITDKFRPVVSVGIQYAIIKF